MLPAMVRTALLLDDYFLRHRTASGHPERPERLPAIRKALDPLENVSIIPPGEQTSIRLPVATIRATSKRSLNLSPPVRPCWQVET